MSENINQQTENTANTAPPVTQPAATPQQTLPATPPPPPVTTPPPPPPPVKNTGIDPTITELIQAEVAKATASMSQQLLDAKTELEKTKDGQRLANYKQIKNYLEDSFKSAGIDDGIIKLILSAQGFTSPASAKFKVDGDGNMMMIDEEQKKDISLAEFARSHIEKYGKRTGIINIKQTEAGAAQAPESALAKAFSKDRTPKPVTPAQLFEAQETKDLFTELFGKRN